MASRSLSTAHATGTPSGPSSAHPSAVPAPLHAPWPTKEAIMKESAVWCMVNSAAQRDAKHPGFACGDSMRCIFTLCLQEYFIMHAGMTDALPACNNWTCLLTTTLMMHGPFQRAGTGHTRSQLHCKAAQLFRSSQRHQNRLAQISMAEQIVPDS